MRNISFNETTPLAALSLFTCWIPIHASVVGGREKEGFGMPELGIISRHEEMFCDALLEEGFHVVDYTPSCSSIVELDVSLDDSACKVHAGLLQVRCPIDSLIVSILL